MSSSVVHWSRIRFDDPQWEKSYKPMQAYGQFKLADFLLTHHLARVARERGWALLSVGAHPRPHHHQPADQRQRSPRHSRNHASRSPGSGPLHWNARSNPSPATRAGPGAGPTGRPTRLRYFLSVAPDVPMPGS